MATQATITQLNDDLFHSMNDWLEVLSELVRDRSNNNLFFYNLFYNEMQNNKQRIANLKNYHHDCNRRMKVYKFYNIINKKDEVAARLFVIAYQNDIIDTLVTKGFTIYPKEGNFIYNWGTEEDWWKAHEVKGVYLAKIDNYNKYHLEKVTVEETIHLYEKLFIKLLKEGYVVNNP